ncbi:MAG: long-chain fatty acid--CoA ligase [Myxococcota bacterium]
MAENNKWYVDESNIWFKKESGWPDEVIKNPEFPKKTLGEMLDETASKYPDNKAVWFLDKFMSYRELKDLTDRFATSLAKLGVKKGDVVAILLPNSFQFVVAYYATVKLGAIATGVNPTYKPMEVLHQLNTVNAKVLIVLDALYEPIAAPILDKSKVETVIATNIVDLAGLSPIKKFLGKLLKKIPTGPVPSNVRQFTDLLDVTPNVPKVQIDPEEDTAAFIMTGGTTGTPKAAVLTHFNLHSNCVQSRHWIWKLQEAGFCSVGVLPLFHSFAMTAVMNISIYAGGWMMLFPRPPETGELLKKIMELSPPQGLFYCGAEILFKRLAEFPGIENYDIAGKITLCISGAGPLHRPVQEAFEKATNAKLVEGYGLTEASPVVSAGPFWGNRKIGTIGLPFPGTEWKILDAEVGDKEMPLGEVGEICVAGPQVMKGYLNRPEETAETIREFAGKRYLYTGDIGYMDEHGQIVIRDRKKQLIKYKGYSVFPKEVEELVGQHECASEVAVAGIPDKDTGERIKAWVVLRNEWKGKITEEELKAWCKENLTHYKVPSYIEFREDLPKSLVGKVLRRVLQEQDPLFIEKQKEMRG